MIDTHCHLNDEQAFPKVAEAIELARGSGVSRLIVIGTDSTSSQRAVEIATQFDGISAVVGWHPTSARQWHDAETETIRELAKHEKVVAIGEIGLDFHWEFSTPEEQRRCLDSQLDLAQELDRPMVFHCREAYDELLEIIESRGPGRYLLHCFGGTIAQARRALDLGAIFGVDGPVTYKSAEDLRTTLKFIGIEHLVLETDAPWLPPVPYRGKPNHPMYLGLIRDGLADVLGLTSAEVEKITDANARAFFGID